MSKYFNSIMILVIISIVYTNAFTMMKQYSSHPYRSVNKLRMISNDNLSPLRQTVLQREQKVKEIEEISAKRNSIFNDSTERSLGRLAMVSFSVMLANELISGQSFFQQFESYGVVTILMSMISFILSPKY